jgi:hypothetical protein
MTASRRERQHADARASSSEQTPRPKRKRTRLHGSISLVGSRESRPVTCAAPALHTRRASRSSSRETCNARQAQPSRRSQSAAAGGRTVVAQPAQCATLVAAAEMLVVERKQGLAQAARKWCAGRELTRPAGSRSHATALGAAEGAQVRAQRRLGEDSRTAVADKCCSFGRDPHLTLA